ncbi:MAG TPA: hypothetical protein VNM90_24590 [Haliangium sp.]|nr:hypothetical protein [Haliangium sp.]
MARSERAHLVVAALMALMMASCTAVSISPPLSPKLTGEVRTFSGVYLTSGTFARPYRVVGVFQMTQTGYKWFHEVELNDDANPGSILYKAGAIAARHGAHGVQGLILVDLDPQTPADKLQKQMESAKRVAEGKSSVFEEGSETRWMVLGEMVQFLDGGVP